MKGNTRVKWTMNSKLEVDSDPVVVINSEEIRLKGKDGGQSEKTGR